jgi:hypothetical protein
MQITCIQKTHSPSFVLQIPYLMFWNTCLRNFMCYFFPHFFQNCYLKGTLALKLPLMLTCIKVTLSVPNVDVQSTKLDLHKRHRNNN